MAGKEDVKNKNKIICFLTTISEEEENGSSYSDFNNWLVELEEVEELFLHIDNELRYFSVGNYDYSWVSKDKDEFRMLCYYFVDRVPMLFQEGGHGKRNEDTMKDED